MSPLRDVLDALDQCLTKLDEGQDALRSALEALEEAGQLHVFGVLLVSLDAEAQQVLASAEQAAEDMVRADQILKRAYDLITRYRCSIATSVPSQCSAPSVSAESQAPVLSRPRFNTASWADDVRQDIQHRNPTVGLVFDDHGSPALTDLDDLRSGPDIAAQEIDIFLKNHPQFPKQRRADVPIASAEHVETKIAMEMRKRGLEHLTVVINNPRGVLSAILPQGSSITVWLPGADVPSELYGGSTI
ncbi:DddA-like double-stranded DNA deaminase toxin [Actinopolyspora erythraea]|uniref:DddA-like double-stranded DNA deaminase toxin n=1 Tax=Actinopolyspora erythraea TaxID=414996 RepID=UPI0011855485|nr:DddA-like double-stranded DNA deaminase toxin [Actinopolyspora erythraea]